MDCRILIRNILELLYDSGASQQKLLILTVLRHLRCVRALRSRGPRGEDQDRLLIDDRRASDRVPARGEDGCRRPERPGLPPVGGENGCTEMRVFLTMF